LEGYDFLRTIEAIELDIQT